MFERGFFIADTIWFYNCYILISEMLAGYSFENPNSRHLTAGALCWETRPPHCLLYAGERVHRKAALKSATGMRAA